MPLSRAQHLPSHSLGLDVDTWQAILRGEQQASPEVIVRVAARLGEDPKRLQVQYLSEWLLEATRQWEGGEEALEWALRQLRRARQHQRPAEDRDALLQRLRTYLAQQPIDKAWLFGSFARKEERTDSDLDLLVRFVQPNRLDLFDYAGLRLELEDLTGRPVDLVEEGYLLPHAAQQADQEKILIYERQAG